MSLAIARLSRTAAHRQVRLWQSHLSWVAPHYAVKCNDMPELLYWFHELNVRFDCASPGEVVSVSKTGAIASDILYANPCKSAEDIQTCLSAGVSRTVVDSIEELNKLFDCKWHGDVLVRLAVPDGQSKHRFSSKFGATLEECSLIFQRFRETGMNFGGFSFHVGSECMNPVQYYQAIGMCSEAAKIAKTYNLAPAILDIGGGFLYDEANFTAAAKEVERARKHFFPYSNTEWIAEPGRFFAQPTITLHVPIIAKRNSARGASYTLNESVYGMFSCIPFDSQTPTFQTDKQGSLKEYTLFGRTCDSADVLGKVQLPNLECGDMLRVQNMGAYTYVSASQFNGFPKPVVELV